MPSSFSVLFYPHLPILNPQISISNVNDTSPFLFWTIVALVTSHTVLPQHSPVFAGLRETYLRMLQTTILTAPLPYHTIQALTYLMVWPLPTDRQNCDATWLYCGVATNAAIYMGLHHPKPTQSFTSIGVQAGSLRARARTWLGCFLASIS